MNRHGYPNCRSEYCETGDGTYILNGHEPEDVNSATSSLNIPVTSEEVARQIKAATDPLTKQLERLCDLIEELRQVPPRRNEDTTGLIQRPSRPHSSRFDNHVFQNY